MLLYRRPDPPSSFTTGATARALAKERARILAEINAGNKPKISKALWGRFKTDFAAAQLNRCGYCECNVIAGHRGDVEHFAPKNDVRRFTGRPGEEGVQIPNSASLKGRTPESFSDLGYWWLAYNWTNYLLSCVVCNQDWKGNLFPVLEPPPRAKPPTEQAMATERALLLNPLRSARSGQAPEVQRRRLRRAPMGKPLWPGDDPHRRAVPHRTRPGTVQCHATGLRERP